MLETYGERLLRVTTICVLLPFTIRCSPDNRSFIPITGKRSLNYIATSVPYTVENQSAHQNELALSHEKVDTALTAQDGHNQEVLDCLNDNHCVNNATANDPPPAEGTFKPYSQDELNKILQKYEGDKDNLEAQETSNKVAANYYSVAGTNNIESTSSDASADSTQDKSKAWNLMQYQQTYNGNKNPYDDKMGWVTLEPIAWSSSQVQKWEPNQKPMWPIPPVNSNWGGGSSSQYQQATFGGGGGGGGGYSDRPWKKPTYQYQNNKPWNANQQNFPKPPQFNEQYGGNQEIITDGQPGFFPPDRPLSSTHFRNRNR